jgi:hypothetical protein
MQLKRTQKFSNRSNDGSDGCQGLDGTADSRLGQDSPGKDWHDEQVTLYSKNVHGLLLKFHEPKVSFLYWTRMITSGRYGYYLTSPWEVRLWAHEIIFPLLIPWPLKSNYTRSIMMTHAFLQYMVRLSFLPSLRQSECSSRFLGTVNRFRAETNCGRRTCPSLSATNAWKAVKRQSLERNCYAYHGIIDFVIKEISPS